MLKRAMRNALDSSGSWSQRINSHKAMSFSRGRPSSDIITSSITSRYQSVIFAGRERHISHRCWPSNIITSTIFHDNLAIDALIEAHEIRQMTMMEEYYAEQTNTHKRK